MLKRARVGGVLAGMETIRDEMAQRLTAFLDQYADPQYDIWKGGRSKARRFTERR